MDDWIKLADGDPFEMPTTKGVAWQASKRRGGDGRLGAEGLNKSKNRGVISTIGKWIIE